MSTDVLLRFNAVKASVLYDKVDNNKLLLLNKNSIFTVLSLLLRNLFFTILQPGVLAGLIPYLIIREKAKKTFAEPLVLYHFLAATVFIIGLAIMLTCIVSFAIKGRGTLSPLDPTKNLVITGLYKFSRNPMYVGVMLILMGEAIFFLSPSLGLYALFVFIGFHAFIVFHEEPRLRKDFKEEYDRYRQKVRRWI